MFFSLLWTKLRQIKQGLCTVKMWQTPPVLSKGRSPGPFLNCHLLIPQLPTDSSPGEERRTARGREVGSTGSP